MGPDGNREPTLFDAPREKERVWSVSELTRVIKTTLENRVGRVTVEGEISNLRQPGSGHSYFTLKDENAQIRAVLFRGALESVKCRPKDGMQVRATGDITVYEKSGEYQVIVRRLEETGRGSLQARFEALKAQLQKEGLFDAARKRPLPALPLHIGIVTSRSGAAIRDMLNILLRRFPNLHILLAPVRVQGDGAADEIAAAIDLLNARGGLDVLIVGRGGGSLEDLWCFNEEVVARAIARSGIPVVSAVGHEIDFTISDFVADLRAPTPSAAAELVVKEKVEVEALLGQAGRVLLHRLESMLQTFRERLRTAIGHHVFRQPRNLMQVYRERLAGYHGRMVHESEGRCREQRQRIDDGLLRIVQPVRMGIQASQQDLRRLGEQLKALSPLAVLGRGYSITRDGKGRVVRSVASVARGDRLETRVEDGMIQSDVTGTQREKRGQRETGERS